MQNLTIVESMLRKLHDSSRDIKVRFPGNFEKFTFFLALINERFYLSKLKSKNQRKVLFKKTMWFLRNMI